MGKKILVMNLGHSSTKLAVYDDIQEIIKLSIPHSLAEFCDFEDIWGQEDYRKDQINAVLKEHDFDLSNFDIIVCRGGAMKPIEGGIYVICPEMIEDMRSGRMGSPPSNVGCLIAYKWGLEYGIPAITADPPVVDELCALARYSGMAEIPRKGSWHALNQKRTARMVATQLHKRYEDLNLIVAHLGSGMSVAAHEKGRAIDVNNALDGDGPFGIERSGSVPTGDLVRLCYSGKYSEREMMANVKGNGGLVSYLHSNSGLEVEKRIDHGDTLAEEVYHAMAYQVAKEIGACAAVLKGQVDAIIITGSIAYSERFVGWIKERVAFISDIYVVPGENEILSLAEYGLRFLNGEEQPKPY